MFPSVCINGMFGKVFVIQTDDAGSRGNVFIWNHLVHVGRYTYTSTEQGKYFNVVEQLLEGLTCAGRLLVLDNAFSAISLLQITRNDWNIAIIATQSSNTKHLPYGHVSVHIFCLFFAFGRLTIFEQDSYNLTKHHCSFKLEVLICFCIFLLFFVLICFFFLAQLKFPKFVSLTKACLRNNRNFPNSTKLDQILKMFWKHEILLFLDSSYQSDHLLQILSQYLIQNSYVRLYSQSSLFVSQFSLISFVFMRLQTFQTALTLKRNMHLT